MADDDDDDDDNNNKNNNRHDGNDNDNDNNDAWDAIGFHPHEACIAEGRVQGREAGRQAGYDEGWKLGQTTALEYGMELGFMQGVVECLQLQLQQTQKQGGDEDDDDGLRNSKTTKALKTCRDLQIDLDRFPRADAIFQQRAQEDDDEEDVEQDDSEQQSNNNKNNDSKDENVRQLLQRIRARFRLLMVQLKMPRVSLQEALLAHENPETAKAAAASYATTEW